MIYVLNTSLDQLRFLATFMSSGEQCQLLSFAPVSGTSTHAKVPGVFSCPIPILYVAALLRWGRNLPGAFAHALGPDGGIQTFGSLPHH